MLINLSDYPSSRWSEKQLEAAKVYGRIVDLPFPTIDPSATAEGVLTVVERYLFEASYMDSNNRCQFDYDDKTVVHIMGEVGFVYGFVNRSVYDCIYSTTEHRVIETSHGDGTTTKVNVLNFAQFRAYRTE